MSMVDNRVVKMTFDNADFEKKIKNTMATLSEFEKSLKMDGAAAGFDKIKSAADQLNLSALGEKVKEEASKIGLASSEASASISEIDDAAQNADFSQLSDSAEDAVIDINNAAAQTDLSPVVDAANEAAEGFNMLEAVALGVLIGIGNKIAEFATNTLAGFGNKVKEFTVQPMIDGFKEYETQIGSIQTIMANTGLNFSADEDIALVNSKLDELNEYADLTIYNFTEMTRNIGTFTAAGVDLDTSVAAIKGIANLAALSGSNSQQASTAMYQLSQALAAGTLKLQDWNSVVNAGMGGEVFQNALKETARAHGIAVDEIIEDAGSFRESLQQGWITSEILTETLNHMAISYKQVGDEAYNAALEEMVANGYTEEQAVEILRLAKVAEQSATKVRTWSQLWDTVKESIGSQWSQIWRNFIGDFKQATDTFTFLSNTISNGVEKLFGGLLETSKRFNESGAFDAIFGGYKKDEEGNDIFDEVTGEMIRIKGALDYLVEAIAKPLDTIHKAFENVYKWMMPLTEEDKAVNIVSLALAFKDFTQSLVINDMAAAGIRRIFEGLFIIFRMGTQIVGDLVAVFFNLVGVIRNITDPLLDAVLVFGGQFGKVLEWFLPKFYEIREAIITAFAPLGDALLLVVDIIAEFFGLDPLAQNIANVGDAVVALLDKIWNIIKLPDIIDKIGAGIRNILRFIGEITGWNDAIRLADEYIKETGKEISVLDIFIAQLLRNPIIAFFKGIFDAVIGIPAALVGFANSIADGFSKTEEKTEQAASKFDLLKVILNVVVSVFRALFTVITTVVNTLVSILIPTLSVVFKVLITLSETIITVVIGAFNTFITVLDTLAAAFGPQIQLAISVFIDMVVRFVDMAVRLTSAFGGLIVKLWDFFTAWKPIKDIINSVKEFKDKVVDFFSKGFSKAVDDSERSVSKGLYNIQSIFNKFQKTIEDFITYITNVTPEQFIQDVKNKVVDIIDSIKKKFEDFANFIMHFSPTDVLQTFIVKIENFREVAYNALDSIFDYLDNAFPEFSDTFEEVYDILFNLITGIVDGLESLVGWISGPLINAFRILRNAIQTIRNNSDDIPSFIANLLGTILLLIVDGVGKIIDIVGKIIFSGGLVLVAIFSSIIELISNVFNALLTGKGFDGVKEAFTNFGSGMLDSIKEKLSEISPAFKTAFDKINEFFNSSKDNTRTWKDSLLDAFDTFIDYLKEIPKKFSGIFDNIKNGLKNTFTSIVDTLSTVNGPIGTIFKSIKEKMESAQEKTQKASEDIPNAFDTIVNKVKTAAKKMYKAVKEFFFGPEEAAESVDEMSKITEGSAESIGGVANAISKSDTDDSGIFGIISRFLGDISSSALEKIKSIPKIVGDILNSIAENITVENIYKVASILRAIKTAKLMSSLGNLFNGLGRLTKAIAKKIDKEEGGAIRDKLRDLALTFAIIGATLWVISTIEDPWQCVLVLTAVEGVLIVADTIASFLTKKFGKGGSELLAASLSVAALSVGILIMLKAIEALNAFDFGANLKGLISFGVILVVLSGIAILISHFGGNNAGTGMLAASASLMIMALAVRMMIGPIKTISEFAKNMNQEELNKSGEALAAVALFMIAMGASLRLAGDHAIAAGIGFVLMGLAVETICEALTSIITAAMLDWDAVKNSFMMLFILIGEFALIAKYVDDGSLIKAGIAIVLFSVGVSVISDAITDLSKVASNDWESTKNSFMILFVMIAEFALIAKYVDDGSLVKAGVAVALFSAGVLILSAAISLLAETDGDIQTATLALAAIVAVFGLFALVVSAIPGSEAVLVSLGIAFIAFGAACLLISVALQNTVDAMMKLAMGTPLLVAFANALSQNLPQFLQAAIALGALGLAFVIFGPTSIVAGAGMIVLATGMNMMSSALPGLIAGTPALILFATTITQHVAQFALAAVGLAAIGAALLIFGPGAIAAGLGLNLLSDGIRNFLILIIQLPTLLQEAGNSAAVLLQMLPEALSNMWENISTWWTTVAWPKIQEVGGLILQKLGEFKDKFVEWWTTTAWPAIQEKLGQFWEWLQTTAIPKLQEIGGLLLQKFGEFKDKFVEWWTTTAWPTIKQKAGEIWQWFQTEGIPKLKEIGKLIFTKLGEALSKFANWVLNDALPAIGKGILDIVNKAKDTFGPKIKDFIEGIPQTIGDAVSGIWEKLKEIGGNIISGIAEGITGFDAQQALSNALNFISNMVPQEVKDFFGMASPSKLMRDEIGPYIPMGLAVGMEKYGDVVKEAAYSMGDNAISGIQDSLSSAKYDIPSPNISPVMNMESFSDDISTYNDLLKDTMINGNVDGRFSEEMSLSAELASKLDSDISKMDSVEASIHDIRQVVYNNAVKTQELYTRTNDILNTLSGEASSIKNKVENGFDVYMDSGALVGAIAPEMDRALGWRTALAERGVY